VNKSSFDSSINDLIHAVGLLVRRIRAMGPQDFSLSETAVLKRLARDGLATTAELARAESMKPQSMGEIIARLEEDGLVRRTPHPTDGRQMYLQATDKGASLLETWKAVKRTWLGRRIAELDKEEQATLFRAAAIIKRVAEQ